MQDDHWDQDRDASFEDQQQEQSRLFKRLLLVFSVLFILYTAGYFVLFKLFGDKNTWNEHYIKNGEYLYTKEYTMAEIVWRLPGPLIDAAYTMYYPAMNIDGKRKDISPQERERALYLYQKYIAHQINPEDTYFITHDEEYVAAHEKTYLLQGNYVYEELDDTDNPEKSLSP